MKLIFHSHFRQWLANLALIETSCYLIFIPTRKSKVNCNFSKEEVQIHIYMILMTEICIIHGENIARVLEIKVISINFA